MKGRFSFVWISEDFSNTSKPCRKYQNEICTFDFGKFFLSSKIVAEVLLDDMAEEVKVQVLKNQSIMVQN